MTTLEMLDELHLTLRDAQRRIGKQDSAYAILCDALEQVTDLREAVADRPAASQGTLDYDKLTHELIAELLGTDDYMGEHEVEIVKKCIGRTLAASQPPRNLYVEAGAVEVEIAKLFPGSFEDPKWPRIQIVKLIEAALKRETVAASQPPQEVGR